MSARHIRTLKLRAALYIHFEIRFTLVPFDQDQLSDFQVFVTTDWFVKVRIKIFINEFNLFTQTYTEIEQNRTVQTSAGIY